jgi:hypothetical protein
MVSCRPVLPKPSQECFKKTLFGSATLPIRSLGIAMGKQITPAEREVARRLAGNKIEPVAIHAKLNTKRAKQHVPLLDLTSVRRFLRGLTHRVDKQETRGRKRVYSRKNVSKMNRERKALIKKAAGEYEVHWDDIMKKARVPKADPTTAARAFAREGIDVAWRSPREKPLRGPEHEKERMDACRRWRFYKDDYFTDSVDLIMDNTTWDVPATARARKYLNQRKVRGHLRTRGEGLQSECTKPSGKKHNMNTGGKLKIVAGISKCRVALWHYIEGPWNGEVAASVYRGPIQKVLRRRCGDKRRYLILEDNDPVGYKSGKAMEAKAELNVRTLQFPRYSPDLNPMDYFLWQEVEARMAKNTPKKLETVEAFKTRVRKTALGIPEAVIRKGVSSMKNRVQNCFASKGACIVRD